MKGVNSVSKKKYSDELKLEIVERYFKEDISAKQLAKEYYIGSEADIKKWIAMYEHHGVRGLCTVNGSYAGNFKVSVVEYMQNTGASIRQTAAYFNIPSPQTVALWQRIFFFLSPSCDRFSLTGFFRYESGFGFLFSPPALPCYFRNDSVDILNRGCYNYCI